jgi:hypothetical protein
VVYSWKYIDDIALLTEACLALTVRLMVPLFWRSYTHFSSHPTLHQPVHRKVMTVEAIGRVSDIVHIGKEVHCGVSAAVRACDVKLFPVAYVSGSLSSAWLIITVVTYVKNAWYLKCHHHLISTQDSRTTAVQFCLFLIQQRSWWRLLVQLWLFGECDVNGGSLRFSWIACHTCYEEGSWLWLD